jgi:hypothetical protein
MKSKIMALRIFGGLLLLTACALAFLWFFWLTPLKNFYSGNWKRDHSAYGRWIEAQTSIQRIGVTHDTGSALGGFGGKEWTIWIMGHIKPGQDITSCEASHLGNALADMTNQQLGLRSDPWLAWWKTNQNKTQLEWIQDGFASKGVVLQQPLTTNNILALLKLANLTINPPSYTNMSSVFQSSLRYNAYRWLRDSGFKAKDLDINSITVEDKDQIIQDLIDYAEWYGIHRDDPGKLRINRNASPDGWTDARFEAPSFRWTLYSIIFALALGGWFLLGLSCQGKRT